MRGFMTTTTQNARSGTYRAFHRYIVTRFPGPLRKGEDRVEIEVPASEHSREIARRIGAQELGLTSAEAFIDFGVIVSKRIDK
jgi:hypothetical protein